MPDDNHERLHFTSRRRLDGADQMIKPSQPPRNQPSPTPEPAVDDEIDLMALLAQVWSGKLIITAFVFLFGVVGLVLALIPPPIYQANSLLQLEERSGTLSLPAGMSSLVDNSPTTITEIEILRSRLVLGRAAADINLDWSIEPRLAPVLGDAMRRYALPIPNLGMLLPFARKGESVRLDLLEVPPEWVGQPLLVTSMGDGQYRVDLPDGSILRGSVGAMLRQEGTQFAIRLGELLAPAGREFVARQQRISDAVGMLRGNLSVSEQGRGSGILSLRMNGPSPREAQRRLDAVAQAYLVQNVSRSAAEAESSLDFVEAQLPEAERAASDAEAALNRFQTEQQSVDLGLETQSLLTQIGTLEAELRALDVEEEQIKQLYTTNHPSYRQLLSNRARLEERLVQLRGESASLPQTQREIINLTQELELAQAVYVQLLNRAQELRVLRASSIGNVRIVDAAQASPFAVAPNRRRTLAMALALGALAGIGTVLLLNFLRRGVQSPDDIEKLGLPVFATINLVEEQYQILGRKTPGKLVALDAPNDLAVEGLRSLRTGLHYGMLDARTRSLAVTSAAPGAGKSFTCANLAIVSAQGHQKVCLIDADMRRGTLRRYFGTEKGRVGLAEVLAGDAILEDAMVEGPVPGLMFLPTGRFPPNPSELLMRETFAHTLRKLDSLFDLTIIDCPPALAVTDPVVIGRAAGSTIAVIRHAMTPVGEIQALQKTLQTGGLALAGTVLNGFDPRKAKAGYGYGYGYRYAYKSEDPDPDR